MKTCIICGVGLGQTNTTWYRQKNYIHKCNDCIKVEKREQAKASRANDPLGHKRRTRKYVAKLKATNPKKYTAKQQCGSASKRARALGLSFDLTVGYIESIAPEFCPILGRRLKYGGGEKTNDPAALDRIDPEKGYIQGNVQVISLLANLMKSNASPEDMILFAKWVLARP